MRDESHCSQSDSSSRAPWMISRAGCGLVLLTLVPLTYLICLLVRHGVDVPFQDQWELVPLLEKTYQGDLTFQDLWAQHNEHRILFPRIIMLAMARVTGWNIRWELALNVALGIAIFVVLAGQIRRSARDFSCPALRWAVPACSLIVFSISQFENWLWGWQIQMFLNLLAAVGGFLLLTDRPFSWLKFACSALLGVVATFSFANGVLFWPIGALLLFPATVANRERARAIAVWILLSVLILGAYLWHYQKPPDHPSLLLVFRQPLEYAKYVFGYFGATCSWEAPSVYGLGGFIALFWSVWMLQRRKGVGWDLLLPYVGVSLYSIWGAMLTGVGRLGFSSVQALTSRYCTMMVPFWVSLAVLLFLVALGPAEAMDAAPALQEPDRQKLRTISRWIAAMVFTAAICLIGLNSYRARTYMKGLSELQTTARAQLVALAANPAIQVGEIGETGLIPLYPRSEIVLQRYPILVKHRLSVFRQADSAPTLQGKTPGQPPGDRIGPGVGSGRRVASRLMLPKFHLGCRSAG